MSEQGYFSELYASHWRIIAWVYVLIFLLMYPSLGYIGPLSVTEKKIQGSIVSDSVSGFRTTYASLTIQMGTEEITISMPSTNKNYPKFSDAVRHSSVGDIAFAHKLQTNYGDSEIISFESEKQGLIFSGDAKRSLKKFRLAAQGIFFFRSLATILATTFLMSEIFRIMRKLIMKL